VCQRPELGKEYISETGALRDERDLDLASTLTPANGAMRTLLAAQTAHLAPILGSTHAASAAALRQLWDLTYREASMMAYADAYRILMIVCLAAACLVPLMSKPAVSPGTSAASHGR
jgi:DHA2 family multidrug resistance protein